MLHIWKPKVDAQAAAKLNLFRKKKSTNAKLQTNFKWVAVLVYCLPPLISCFSTILNLTKPELHKQKHSDYQITPSFIECRVKITFNEKNGTTALNTWRPIFRCKRKTFSVQTADGVVSMELIKTTP
jgi:hypothetical protein